MTEAALSLRAVRTHQGADLADQTSLADRLTADALRLAVTRLDNPLRPLDTVLVGGLPVADATRSEVVDHLVAAVRSGAPVTAFALHVGGLLARKQRDYADAMRSADLVYADGVSVVELARQAGATRIERAATTDIGIDLLERLAAEGATPRLALIGGPPGLAERAGAGLAERFGLALVLTEHGFHDDWEPILARLTEAAVDVVVVGLGAPREMLWCRAHRHRLPGLVLTCGGWFGFLAGDERRSPLLLQRLGCEWVWRWAQQPRRLARRYVLGAAVCLRLALALRLRRILRREQETART